MASELDAYLGRTVVSSSDGTGTSHDEAVASSDSEIDPWLLMAKSDPSAWRRRGNPWTDRIAQMIADDAMLPRDGQVGKHIHGVAVACLEELGDPETVEDAIQECRRTKANWRELSIWIMKTEIMFAGRRMKARSYFVGHLNDDPVGDEDPLVFCPRCHKLVLPYRVDMDCKGH